MKHWLLCKLGVRLKRG